MWVARCEGQGVVGRGGAWQGDELRVVERVQGRVPMFTNCKKNVFFFYNLSRYIKVVKTFFQGTYKKGRGYGSYSKRGWIRSEIPD